MTIPGSLVNLFKKFLHSSTFLQELRCKLQVDVSQLNRCSLYYNCEKTGQLLIEYTLFLKPQFAKSKKPKQNRAKKNDFVDTYLLNLLNSCVLLLRVLRVFLSPFTFSTTFPPVTNRNKGPIDNFQARGGRDI